MIIIKSNANEKTKALILKLFQRLFQKKQPLVLFKLNDTPFCAIIFQWTLLSARVCIHFNLKLIKVHSSLGQEKRRFQKQSQPKMVQIKILFYGCLISLCSEQNILSCFRESSQTYSGSQNWQINPFCITFDCILKVIQ